MRCWPLDLLVCGLLAHTSAGPVVDRPAVRAKREVSEPGEASAGATVAITGMEETERVAFTPETDVTAPFKQRTARAPLEE